MGEGIEIEAKAIEKQQTLLRTELKLPKIRTSNQELVDFDPKRIMQVYINEAGLDEETAEYYTQLIMADLNKLYIQNRLHEISTRMVRELMCAHAIQQGDFQTRNKLSVVGLPIKDVEKLFFNYNSENSNHVPSEEFIHKAMADVMNEQYSFSTLYNFNTQWGNPAYAHMNADIYIHDRDYVGRPFCLAENEMVLVEKDGKAIHRRIGELLSSEFQSEEGWLACNKFKVLSFDFKGGKQIWAASKNIVKKKSNGEMMKIFLEGGRKMGLDPQHRCIVLRNGKFETMLASEVIESDFFPVFTEIQLPEKDTNEIDLIESGIKGVYVKGAQKLIEKTGKTHKEIARDLSVSKSTVTAWHINNGIPVDKFRQIEQKYGVSIPHSELKLSAAGGSSKQFNAIISVDNTLMDFLGYYVAEGHCKKNGKMKIALNMKKEANVAHYLKGIVSEITGINARIEWEENHNVVNVVVDSLVLKRFLEMLGTGRTAREKRVPDIVWNVSKEKRQRFIKALFAGDGHIKNWLDENSRSTKAITRSQYTTVSDQLATGYAMLLASEGISTHSSFQQEYNAHRIHVDMGQATEAFSNLIGYQNPVLTSGSISFSNLLPRSIAPPNVNAKGSNKISIAKLMQHEIPEDTKKIIESNVRFAKVKSIKKEKYDGYFYCFETESGVISHGNGIISHNCFQHSARFIFRNGLYIDGTGRHVNVSRPPKNLEVAIRQVCEFLGAASRNWNGGQSFRNLFWELGPFLESAAKSNSATKNLGGVDIPVAIVQAAQMMRYEPNHILVGRGSQAAFSSLSNFAVPPKYLTEDTDIVLPGGQVVRGSYADYREYVLKFWYAYLFESTKGDANGGMFHWMKDDVGIKPAWFKDPELQQYLFEPLMKYIAKFGGPYIYNVKNVSDDEVACTSCCSLVLATESPEDYELARQGTLGMGALQCGSFNLPRIAYLAGGDDAKVYELIDARMNLLAEVMKAKKAFMKKILATGVAPFLTQPRLRGKDPVPYFDIEKQSYLLSFCGMNEFTKFHLGHELHESKDAHNYAMKLVMHMIDYAKKLSEETGLNLAIWRQPGESLRDTEKVLICNDRGYRFEEIGQLVESYFRKYPDAIQISAQGNEYLDLEKLGISLKTASLTNFKTAEKQVTALVKHPKKDVLKVKLTGGKEISVTANHSLFTLNQETLQIDEISASDLKEGSWVVTLDKMSIKGKKYESMLYHLDSIPADKLERVFISGRSVPHMFDAAERSTIGAWLDTTDRKTALKDALSGFKSKQIMPLGLCKYLGTKFNGNSKDFDIHIGSRTFPANLTLSNDIGYLAGLYLAEGSLKRGIISMTDKGSIEDVKRIVSGITDSNCQIAEKWGEKSTMPLYVFDAGADVMKYLNLTLGFELETSHNKTVPPAIMASDEGCLKGFIKGYFEGDGTMSYNPKKHDFGISFSTASRSLANDIVFVLARLGAGSKICLKKGGREYRITTSNRESAVKIAEILGVPLPPALEKSTTTNLIPHAGAHIRMLRKKHGIASEKIKGINGRSLRDIEAGNGMITKLKLQKLVDALEPETAGDNIFEKLKRLAFSDIEFEQVVSLEPEGKFHVYDLEVRPNGEPVENFTAGLGLVLSHNTMPGKFAQDDYKKFNGKAVLQGNPKAGAAYYSNFTHVNVNSGLPVFDKIKNEAPFHALSPSNLLHVWLGEANPDPGALWDMTQKILDKSLTTYFAFTREITVCNSCKTSHPGVVSHCACGAGPKDLVVNSRIVGYYSAVGTVEAILNWRKNQSKESLKGAYWQPHKFAEFHNRVANYSGARLSKLEAV